MWGREVLGLNGFVQLEGSRPDVNENQHVHNKLIYDVANEVLSATDHRHPGYGHVGQKGREGADKAHREASPRDGAARTGACLAAPSVPSSRRL